MKPAAEAFTKCLQTGVISPNEGRELYKAAYQNAVASMQKHEQSGAQ